MKRPVLLGLFLFLLALPARADIIELDDGRKIEGEILSETDDEVEIKIPYGATKFPRSQIVKITRKPSPEQEFKARRDKLDAKDAAGRIDLARWALDHHFPREKAAELSIEAWRLEPGNDGSIELLFTKLEYRYEKDVWVDPEHWCPLHGYVRRNGVFLTTEEAAYQDALALVAKLKVTLAADAADVKNAEDLIAQGPEREKKIKKDVDDMTAAQSSLTAKKATAKTLLDTRESDLTAAVEATVNARQTLLQVQQSAPNNTTSIALAQGLVSQAAIDESRARKNRDNALSDYQTVSANLDKVTGKLATAKSALDALQTLMKNMTDSLPQRRKARDDAAQRLAQGETATKDARKAADDRKARDVKDAAVKLEELRALKKK